MVMVGVVGSRAGEGKDVAAGEEWAREAIYKKTCTLRSR